MTKFYAYTQEDFRDEKFEIREFDGTMIVLAAPDEESAREAFNSIVEEQIRAMGNEPSESDFDFIVDEFTDSEIAYTEYNFDEV